MFPIKLPVCSVLPLKTTNSSYTMVQTHQNMPYHFPDNCNLNHYDNLGYKRLLYSCTTLFIYFQALNLIINFMEHSPSSEANISSPSQEIPHIFMEIKGSVLCSWSSAPFPHPQPDQSTLCPQLISRRPKSNKCFNISKNIHVIL